MCAKGREPDLADGTAFSISGYDFPAGLVEVLSRDFNGDDKSDSLRVGYSPSSGYTWTVALMGRS
jgi:hypothetical protein